jgi:hypothetical protein
MLILHLPVSFTYVLSCLLKNMHTVSEKSNNNGFWIFFSGSARFPVPYRTVVTLQENNDMIEVPIFYIEKENNKDAALMHAARLLNGVESNEYSIYKDGEFEGFSVVVNRKI